MQLPSILRVLCADACDFDGTEREPGVQPMVKWLYPVFSLEVLLPMKRTMPGFCMSAALRGQGFFATPFRRSARATCGSPPGKNSIFQR